MEVLGRLRTHFLGLKSLLFRSFRHCTINTLKQNVQLRRKKAKAEAEAKHQTSAHRATAILVAILSSAPSAVSSFELSRTGEVVIECGPYLKHLFDILGLFVA